VASCKLVSAPSSAQPWKSGTDETWVSLAGRLESGQGAAFQTGGLGGLSEPLRFEVWVCEEGHSCANGTSAFFCFAFDEVDKVFVPWGPDSMLGLSRPRTPS